jgi:hypothetical protein
MADLGDLDNQPILFDRIDDPVVPLPDAIFFLSG